MGQCLWNQWARLISLTAGVFQVIGGIFAFFYRYSMFNPVININNLFNPFNYFAVICTVTGLIILAIELPLPFLKNTFLVTSFIPRILLYIPISFVSVFNYQNVNPALYLFIATLMYLTASLKGETNRVNNTLRSKV
ncbi:hypothetical protein RclHR1_07430005 [Rhizophagus clarus]|uniref:PRO41 protein n=1 Tax=Rhizophagus clarus TaxID=94130 RepID=A0A2Z6S383_9GLOM|nr:hypothetical protein RclHR1_07430005 [Rhizophagus clarus]GES86862.1 PRO41 protein [Rhizophagus clarus]